jgi:hypothetical protein
MPTYTFKLCDDGDGVEDDAGVSLPDANIAYVYACDVVRELMSGRERTTRHWQLEVYEGQDEKIFEIAFASLDPTLDHLDAHYRQRVEQGARQIRSARDALGAAAVTVQEAKSLVARSRGKPYLAAERGRKVVRD